MTVERIFCAVDTADLDAAMVLAELLRGEVGGLKLGKEFFTAHGPAGVKRIAATGHRIFLDLKFHDIPNTVAGAVRAAADLGVHMLTVHAAGGEAMMRAAVQAAENAAQNANGARPLILAVTVLTSLDEADLVAIGQNGPIAEQVARLATLAKTAGIDGAVCSPLEIETLKSRLGAGFALVVPGVRPGWATSDDQKRVMTPGDAVGAGADYLVIGRPITRADDPVSAARRIADEMPA
jgi:orotidine-5'-phosphate decarboxylase